MADKFTEEEMAAVAESYFASKGWSVFPEVVIPHFGGRVDIMATKGALCAAIECKTNFSYTVLEQLIRWKYEYESYVNSEYADESVKGIPHLLYAVVGGSRIVSDLKKEILQNNRIGLIHASVERDSGWRKKNKSSLFDDYGYAIIGNDRWHFDEVISPKIQVGSRKTASRIVMHLNEDMKVGIAGSSGSKGAYMTPFKRTMNKAKSVIDRGGEWHISNIISVINSELSGHHYINDSSAKAQIAKFLVELEMAEKVYDMRPVFKAIGSDK